MLDKAVFVNFQPHKKTEIEFEQITTIIGKNDVGKSSSLRGVKWVCTNKPSGDSFIRHGEKYTQVDLFFDDHQVTRHKGDGKNYYELDGAKYKAFGAGKVPDEIVSFLNVDETNFQPQEDSYYWFRLTPGQVAKELNKIVDLSLIDSSLANAANAVRKAKSISEVCKTRLKAAKQKQLDLSWVKDANLALTNLEVLKASLDERQIAANKLTELLTKAQKLRKRLKKAHRLAQASTELLELGQGYVKAHEAAQWLAGALKRAKALSKGISKPLKGFDQLAAHANVLGEIINQVAELRLALDKAKALRVSICQSNQEERELAEEIERKFDRCPLCGQRREP